MPGTTVGASPGLVGRELAVRGAVQHYREFLVGKDPRRIGALWQEMYRSQYFEGGRVLTAAISAIDLALHDVVARSLGVPVYQLLGGAQRDWVPCFTTSHAAMGPEAVEDARRLVADGWPSIRFTFGVPDTGGDPTLFEPRESIAMTSEWMLKMREAVGSAPVLGMEYHHRLSVAEAASFCQRMPSGTLDFLEEPIRDETPAAYEALRRMTDVPFAIGEEFASKWQFLPYIEGGIVNFARIDICNVGGFTEAMKVAGWCEAHYIDMMPHNPLGPISTAANLHFAAAVPNYAWLEERTQDLVFGPDNVPGPAADRRHAIFSADRARAGGRVQRRGCRRSVRVLGGAAPPPPRRLVHELLAAHRPGIERYRDDDLVGRVSNPPCRRTQFNHVHLEPTTAVPTTPQLKFSDYWRRADMTGIPRSASGKSAAQVAREAALRAGEILVQRFRTSINVSYKGRGNIVTDVDTEVEEEVLDILRREYPDMGLLGEESAGKRADTGYVWIVDPLDGTRNYASGIPFFSTVIGLALDGEVLVGVNYDPVRGDLFEAERGGGAFLNGERAAVSERTELADSIIGTDLSYNNRGAANGLEVVREIWPGMQTARIMGSAALGLSYAATGLTDLYFHHQLEPWDQVAGLLLAEEAGGVVTDRTGRRAGLYSDGIVVSSRALHTEFMRRTEGMAWRESTRAVV